jgi:hypothetical protein
VTSPGTGTGGGTGARILDRRYQRYTGPRKGQAHAARRLMLHAFQRFLGLRRPGKYKIVPITIGALCYLPTIAFIGIAALVPVSGGGLVSYSQLFGIIAALVGLFIVTTGPGGLIADRNSKSLSLYLASPLDRNTYLMAHFGALLGTLALVTVGPPLLYLIGSMFQGIGPSGVGGAASTAGKILLAGGALAAYYTSLTMAVASVSNRAAQAGVLLFLALSVPDALVGAALLNADAPDALLLLAPGTLPDELVRRIFGPVAGALQAPISFDLATPLVALGTAAWALAALALVWFRYHRLDISR